MRAARARRLDREGRALAPAAATVEGFIGFAIGRSIWWDALKGFLAKELEREAAAAQIADNYLHFVEVYEGKRSSTDSDRPGIQPGLDGRLRHRWR